MYRLNSTTVEDFQAYPHGILKAIFNTTKLQDTQTVSIRLEFVMRCFHTGQKKHWCFQHCHVRIHCVVYSFLVQKQINCFIVSVAFSGQNESRILTYLTHAFLEIITLVLNANKALHINAKYTGIFLYPGASVSVQVPLCNLVSRIPFYMKTSLEWGSCIAVGCTLGLQHLLLALHEFSYKASRLSLPT